MIGTWEQFQIIHNGDGSIAFRSRINGEYVCADNAGASPLIANCTAIGQWESFDQIRLTPDPDPAPGPETGAGSPTSTAAGLTSALDWLSAGGLSR